MCARICFLLTSLGQSHIIMWLSTARIKAPKVIPARSSLPERCCNLRMSSSGDCKVGQPHLLSTAHLCGGAMLRNWRETERGAGPWVPGGRSGTDSQSILCPQLLITRQWCHQLLQVAQTLPSQSKCDSCLEEKCSWKRLPLDNAMACWSPHAIWTIIRFPSSFTSLQK